MNYTVVELKNMAKNKGLSGYSKLTKAELVSLLEEKTETRMETRMETRSPKKDLRYERQKPSVAPRVASPRSNEGSPTIRDLLPKDPVKVVRIIQKEYTPDFIRLKRTTPTEFVKVSQLGKPGKEGTVYLVTHPASLRKYAMKTFRKKKSGKTLEKEAFYQYLASKRGVSPNIIEYNPEEKYIVMEVLNNTLMDILKSQGTLTVDQQSQIIQIYKLLDEIGIMLNDANPLNIMEKNGRLYAIDYGFAQFTDHKDFKDYSHPNYQLMPLGLLLWLKDRCSTKNWTVIRNSISAEVKFKMKIDEWG